MFDWFNTPRLVIFQNVIPVNARTYCSHAWNQTRALGMMSKRFKHKATPPGHLTLCQIKQRVSVLDLKHFAGFQLYRFETRLQLGSI